MYFSLKNKYQGVIPEWEEDRLKSIGSEIIQVVGLNFSSKKQAVKTLSVGDKVVFKRDPKNVYDANALLVFTEDNKEIGFVSADWAVIYSPKIDMGMTFDAEITSIESKVISIRVKRNNFDKEIVFDFFK